MVSMVMVAMVMVAMVMVAMVMVAMVMVAMVMVYYACYETSIFIGPCIDTLHSLLPSFSVT